MPIRRSSVGDARIASSNRAPDSPRYFSQAMIVSENTQLIFTSGFNSRDPRSNEVLHRGDVVAQTRTALTYLEQVLTEAGAGMQHVVKLSVFYSDMADMAAVREVRTEFFPVDPPVCTGVGVQLPDPAMLIEIDAVAIIPFQKPA